MVPTRRSVMAFFVLIFLVLAGSARATPEVAVVNLLPRHFSPQPAQLRLSQTFDTRITLREPPSRLLDTLRWAASDPAREQCLQETAQPHELAALLPALLELAGEQVRSGAFQEALNVLSRIRGLLPCQDLTLPTGQIQQLFMLEARAHFGLADGHELAAFEALLAVDPRLELEPDESARLALIFGQARSRVMLSALAQLDTADVPNAAWLDGRLLRGLEAVRAGTHVLQLQGPSGEMRTRLVSFRPGEGRRFTDLAGFTLPAVQETWQALARAIAAGRLEPEQARALDRYLASVKGQRIAFLTAGEDGQAGASPQEVNTVLAVARKAPTDKRRAPLLVVRVYSPKGGLMEARSAADLVGSSLPTPRVARTAPAFQPRKPLNLSGMMFPATVLAAPPSLSARIQRTNRLRRGGFCVALLSSGMGAGVFFSFNDVARGQHAMNMFRPTSEPAWLMRGWVSSVMQNTSRLGTSHYGRAGLLGAGLYVGARLVGSSRSELSVFGGLAQTRAELWSGQKEMGRWQTGLQGRF